MHKVVFAAAYKDRIFRVGRRRGRPTAHWANTVCRRHYGDLFSQTDHTADRHRVYALIARQMSEQAPMRDRRARPQQKKLETPGNGILKIWGTSCDVFCVYKYMYTCQYVCMFVSMPTCIDVCIHVYMYLYMYTCIYGYIVMCLYVCMCMRYAYVEMRMRYGIFLVWRKDLRIALIIFMRVLGHFPTKLHVV